MSLLTEVGTVSPGPDAREAKTKGIIKPFAAVKIDDDCLKIPPKLQQVLDKLLWSSAILYLIPVAHVKNDPSAAAPGIPNTYIDFMSDTTSIRNKRRTRYWSITPSVLHCEPLSVVAL